MQPNVRGHFVRSRSGWRHAAASGIWKAPADPSIYGVIEADVTGALDYLAQVEAATGEKVTITHLVSKAVAHGLAENPQCNGYIRFRRVYLRDEVDVFVLVAITPDNADVGGGQKADLSGVVIRGADRMSLVELARKVRESARGARTEGKEAFDRLRRALGFTLPTVTRLGLKLSTFLQYELNLNLSRLGVPKDSFGGAMVSSMGMFGVKLGFPAIVPIMRHSLSMGVCRVEERPWVVDGQICVRSILPLSVTLDHRVVDGYQAGKVGQAIKDLLEDPARFLGPAAPQTASAANAT
jgi:pyruvate/2-oxoglutarate dehydrogenase complex dihydrolipoamide acyltransferase (E2) component